jgi:hypothetical protein
MILLRLFRERSVIDIFVPALRVQYGLTCIEPIDGYLVFRIAEAGFECQQSLPRVAVGVSGGRYNRVELAPHGLKSQINEARAITFLEFFARQIDLCGRADPPRLIQSRWPSASGTKKPRDPGLFVQNDRYAIAGI